MFPESNFAVAIGADSFVCELLLEALAGTPMSNKNHKEGMPLTGTPGLRAPVIRTESFGANFFLPVSFGLKPKKAVLFGLNLAHVHCAIWGQRVRDILQMDVTFSPNYVFLVSFGLN